MPSCKISWWKNVNETGRNSLYLIYNIFSLGKMAGKSFSWRSVEYELIVKYLENLATEKNMLLFWMMLNKSSVYL